MIIIVVARKSLMFDVDVENQKQIIVNLKSSILFQLSTFQCIWLIRNVNVRI